MEYFKEFSIQKKILSQFQIAQENNKIAHAYLFHGSEGSGKEAVALELAKLLNCTDIESRPCNKCPACIKINKLNHPDVQFVFPVSSKWNIDDIKKRINEKAINPYSAIDQSGSTNIPVKRIRELKNEAKYQPYESTQKVYIICDADKMNRESANSFLKLLEEPPLYLTLILITSFKNNLLDTIRSRCRLVHFPSLSDEEIINIVRKFHPIDEKTNRLIRYSRGNIKTVFSKFDEDFEAKQNLVLIFLRASASGSAQKISEAVDIIYRKRDKNYLMEILNLLILWFRDVLHIVNFGNEAQITSIEHSEELTKFTNAYNNTDFEIITKHIEEAIQNASRNVHAPLLLTTLALRIKKQLIRN